MNDMMMPRKSISNRIREWDLLLDSLSAEIFEKFDASNEHDAISQLFRCRGIREIFGKWLAELTANESPSDEESLCKSEELSHMWREKGNTHFRAGSWAESVRCYSCAVLRAPRCGLALPLALANRAAALLKLDQYRESVRDAELALREGYPVDRRRGKLLARLQLARSRLPPEGSWAMPGPDSPEGLRGLLATPHPHLPGASASLGLEYSEESGRHVVVTQAVKRGDILFVEEPFSLVTLPGSEVAGVSAVCEDCLRTLPGEAPVPCWGCAGAVYCAEACRARAWARSHRWECRGLRALLWPSIGIAHLALRTLLVAGWERAPWRPAAPGPEERSPYAHVYTLVTNFDKMDKKDFLQYALTSVMLATYLERHTDFLRGEGAGEAAARLLLRHVGQLVSCGHSVSAPGADWGERLATALYPGASMMNHACEADVASEQCGGVLVVRAARGLRAGEEVHNCYGPHYRRMAGPQRRASLRAQYCFGCCCSACLDPCKDLFFELFKSFSCDKCAGPASGEGLVCRDCGSLPEDVNTVRHLSETALKLYEKALNLEGKDKISTLQKVLKVQKSCLYKYNLDLRKTKDQLAQCYASEGHHGESAELVRAGLEGVRCQFGESGAELAHERLKLASLLLESLHSSPPGSEHLRSVCAEAKHLLADASRIFQFTYGPWAQPCKEITRNMSLIENVLLFNEQDFN